MAHSCPECDQCCHCGGDVDDCIIDGNEAQMKCNHCPWDGVESDDEDIDDMTDWFEQEQRPLI